MVIIEGKQETANSSRSFYKKFTIPHGVKPEDITSNLNPQGVLTIYAPINQGETPQLLQQQETKNSTTTVEEETTRQMNIRKQQVQHQEVSQSENLSTVNSTATEKSIKDTIKKVGEDFILRPTLNADSVLAQDSKFEDVSKDVCHVNEGKTFEVRFY